MWVGKHSRGTSKGVERLSQVAKKQKGLRAYLGTDGYYRRFIPDFASWAWPLFDALKKGAPCVLQ